MSLSNPKVRPPSRKSSSSKTTHVCHHYDAFGHNRLNCSKLFSHKWVSNRSHHLSKSSMPIIGTLLKVLRFLSQFQENSNSYMSFSRHTRTLGFSSSRPKTYAVWLTKDFKTLFSALILPFYTRTFMLDFLSVFGIMLSCIALFCIYLFLHVNFFF